MISETVRWLAYKYNLIFRMVFLKLKISLHLCKVGYILFHLILKGVKVGSFVKLNFPQGRLNLKVKEPLVIGWHYF